MVEDVAPGRARCFAASSRMSACSSYTSSPADPTLPDFSPSLRARVSTRPPRLVLMSIAASLMWAMVEGLTRWWVSGKGGCQCRPVDAWRCDIV